MKQRSGLRLLAAVVWAVALARAAAAGGEPSTSDERLKAVRLARELEADPLAPGSLEKRQWLIRWYERVPDITVSVCDLLGPFPKLEHPYFSEVVVQLLISGGAFIIEHPERARDQVSIQTAAVLGALKVYEVFAKAKPEQRLPFVDDLIARRDKGGLEDHLKKVVPEKCK